MRRLTRLHLSIRVSLVRVLSLLLLAFVFALTGWLFYMQPTSPGANGEEKSAVVLPIGATPLSGRGSGSSNSHP